MHAAEAVADDDRAMELYEQWQQMAADGAALADWISWEQDLQRSPVLLRFFAAKDALKSAPGCNNTPCLGSFHGEQSDV